MAVSSTFYADVTVSTFLAKFVEYAHHWVFDT